MAMPQKRNKTCSASPVIYTAQHPQPSYQWALGKHPSSKDCSVRCAIINRQIHYMSVHPKTLLNVLTWQPLRAGMNLHTYYTSHSTTNIDSYIELPNTTVG